MKILFFGSKGWIGQQFVEYLNAKNVEYVDAKVRADDKEAVENEIKLVQPTHIISFIGRTHGEGINTIDYLEQPGKLVDNIRDNLYAPIVLSLLAKKHKIHFTYLGTGCIFTAEDPIQSSFSEEDKPNFFGSSYSIVKGFTDRLQHLFEENTLNVRIRMPISDKTHPRNFITKIASYEKVCSIPNSMTVLPDIFPIIYDMMQKKTTGTFNMVNRGTISHNEILQMYKEIVDPEFTWTNFTIVEQDELLLSKRSNNQLTNDKLYALYPELPDIHSSVKKCLETMRVV
jgi:dTDP-4-dehydrorhamnose reductase